MIGYHYTSYDDWLQIKKDGLVPYLIYKPELQKYFPNQAIMGIWVWKQRFHGAPHAGSVLHQVAFKATPHVVLLSVDYSPNDILKYQWPETKEWGEVNLTHDGNIEQWIYHTGKEESVIVTKRISPSHIKLLKEYDIVELLK